MAKGKSLLEEVRNRRSQQLGAVFKGRRVRVGIGNDKSLAETKSLKLFYIFFCYLWPKISFNEPILKSEFWLEVFTKGNAVNIRNCLARLLLCQR